ncbi:uncharacterized protein ACLA_079480 [Aspergillus clavatus NRRL 1]|uniref:MIT domain-containing protein n=1 Tax=Aspergillus clavatus (strain ATCC 1007 / CBS 513.65 / DSM 816 / NCTC 3887 / NRRL 1 / QM 1276 / 107) TaxID=344612 RepID=A1CSH7_ASPCL|nr:uncharacterized protein ACLA_079480 [Aspergillus clavatus NRRL 1]EAW06264.1 conserved hypothetical protein [Aspergillus clavatus NRRL 1]
MHEHLTLEGGTRPSYQQTQPRPESATVAPVPSIEVAASRQSQSSSWNYSLNQVEKRIAESVPHSGTATPTMPGLVSESIIKLPLNPSNDHDEIQEGLGSLNRWSQSTVSTRDSPLGHSRRSSLIHDRTLSETNASPNRISSPQHNLFTDHHIQGQSRHISRGSVSPSQTISLELTPFNNHELPRFATTDVDKAALHSKDESSEFALTAPGLFQNPWTKSGVTDMDSVEHTTAYESTSPHYVGDSSHSSAMERVPGKRRRAYSQKAMLSKALQKANTAVLLDNAANFEGAMEAYNDACQLLQLVMRRSNGGEDERLKLQEIRDTYMLRVTELRRMDFSFREANSKALPERPLSQESFGELSPSLEDNDYHDSGTRINYLQPNSFLHRRSASGESRILAPDQIPPRRQSLLPSPLDDEARYATVSPAFDRSTKAEPSWQPPARLLEDAGVPGQVAQMPEGKSLEDESQSRHHHAELSLLSTHARDIYESTSWLDTIDESGASSPSSTHSQVSSVYLRRRSRPLSHGTEAEFDAALDAAVEAAYDEGLEPAVNVGNYSSDDDVVAHVRKNVELAKQRVREVGRETTITMHQDHKMQPNNGHSAFQDPDDATPDYLDDEAEEEERLLEEMTRGYVMDDFAFDLQSKSALPRQSDTNTFLGRTWDNTAGSAAVTTAAGLALSPLTEDDIPSTTDSEADQNALPSLKHTHISTPDESTSMPKQASVPGAISGVRARRMSGQNMTELTIETSSRSKSANEVLSQERPADSATFRPPLLPRTKSQINFSTPSTTTTQTPASMTRSMEHVNQRRPSVVSLTEDSPTTEVLDRGITQEELSHAGTMKVPSPVRLIGKVPSAPDNLGKLNSGLKAFRPRNVSVPAPDPSAISPDTPSSGAFTDFHKGPAAGATPSLPTPIGATFTTPGLTAGGLCLFDSHIHSPTSPGSPNPMAANAPVPLEPCPESFLLRPFWLMRCIYQTIAHPRGGYLSRKLFVPHDIWAVKNVKLKAVEEKVSNCDLLTAALLKLAKVDTYDADAVLEEMQSLETVLDQVQVSLSKKISSEVGVQGAMPLFRYSQSTDEVTNATDVLPSKVSTVSGKSSYLTSWRKLRSKNSGFGAAVPPVHPKEATKDNLTIHSLPMTSTPISQSAKRNTAQFQFTGPNANYMAALARLCDAAQVLDQIAQQVEDPGLRLSSPTLIGLELSTRHAAEFFGFYVCRFALNDIGIMLDKFIKRGSEWVLI